MKKMLITLILFLSLTGCNGNTTPEEVKDVDITKTKLNMNESFYCVKGKEIWVYSSSWGTTSQIVGDCE